MSFSRCVNLFAVLGGLCGVEGARRNLQRRSKVIAGVPVLNYHLAHLAHGLGAESLASLEKDWVVVMKPSATDAQINEFCDSLTKVATRCQMVGLPSSGGVPFFEFSGSEEKLKEVLEAVGSAAKFAEPDLRMAPIPEVEAQAQGQGASIAEARWNLEKVGASLRPGTGKNVHIYVVDTGIRATHSDFGGRAVPALDVTSGAPVECKGDLTCAGDIQGHGTHCAGIAAGSSFGVASEAMVHSVRVFETGESPFSWSYAALNWITEKGERPVVASMSLGGEGQLAGMKEAVDAAVAAGVTVVAAGGNSDKDACDFSPAFLPSAITVGSTTRSDTRSGFSNWGTCVDIWAPGSEIESAGSFTDTSTKVLSGSSMACPHVSGAAALVLEATPSLTPAKVRNQMLDSGNAGAIVAGLKSSDSNVLLWVGAGDAPAPTPAVCPDFGRGPDADGDCRCARGRCYQGGDYGCEWSRGSMSSSYFLASCWNCKCLR